MTMLNNEQIKCHNCQTEFSFILHRSVNVSIDNDVKEQVLKGDLNVGICPNCGFYHRFDGGFLYHDMNNKIMMQVLSKSAFVDTENAKKLLAKYMLNFFEMTKGLNPNLRVIFQEDYYYGVAFGTEMLKMILDEVENDPYVERGFGSVPEESKKELLDWRVKFKIFFDKFLP